MELKSQASLGQAVRSARKRKGWSQADLATRAGLSRQSMVALEQGDANPRLDTVLRLTGVLGMDLRFMFENSGQLVLPNSKPSEKRKKSGGGKVLTSGGLRTRDSYPSPDTPSGKDENVVQPSLLDADGNVNLDTMLGTFRVTK